MCGTFETRVSARVLALRASVEREAEPKLPEDGEYHERGDDRDELRVGHLLHDDVNVARHPEREGDERRDEYLRGEAVEVLRLLAALDDAVVCGRRHQEHYREGVQAERREVHVLRERGQLVEALREYEYELEA